MPTRTGALRGDRIEISVPPGLFSGADATPETKLVSAYRSVFMWPQPPARSGIFQAFETPRFGLGEALSRIEFLNIQPSAMRDYGRRNAPLGNEGRNISGVLAQLCDDAEAKRAITDWLAEFCAPEIVDIDFVEVKELGDVMAMFVEKSGRRLSVRSASDGTLRFSEPSWPSDLHPAALSSSWRNSIRACIRPASSCWWSTWKQ
ncbi:hypothetical protein ACN28S_24085 [Cystobacter fuscus]